MEGAAQQGVCLIAVQNSHHPGAMASTTLHAARRGFLAWGHTNTGPKLSTFGSKGTNFGASTAHTSARPTCGENGRRSTLRKANMVAGSSATTTFDPCVIMRPPAALTSLLAVPMRLEGGT